MKLRGIYTIRDTVQPYYWDIVFEWEDIFSKALNLPLIRVGSRYDNIYKPSTLRKVLNRLNIYQRFEALFRSSDAYLAFHIGPPGVYSFYTSPNVIPIIIDFWKHEPLGRLRNIFSNSSVVFVTSKEVCNFLAENSISLPIEHLAVSLPDSCLYPVSNTMRRHDIVQFGRQNSLLTAFVKRLLEERPEIDYVFAEKVGDKQIIRSTKYGDLGEARSRTEFMNILRQSKVCLVSTPGIDGDTDRTGGFSPVTPRFLEAAGAGCQLVGTYADNADSNYFDLEQICKRVSDYDSFKSEVLEGVSRMTPVDHHSYLANHLTSARASELIAKLSIHGI